MAEGRMLKKAISTSKKLAELKDDTSRLIYTWMLAHLDIEGRFSADPDVIKGYIVPRIKSITPTKIEKCLKDMEFVGLIDIYNANGDEFLQYHKFCHHQTLRKDRERASQIPPPGELQDKSRRTPPQDKIREDKIKEDKTSEQNENWFNQFWNSYGKKIDKDKCSKWYKKNVIKEEKHIEIMEGVKRWMGSGNWDDNQFQPYPMTFLNNKRWEDEPPAKALDDEERKRNAYREKFIRGEIG